MGMTYDIGPPKELEPDWELLKIDAVAKMLFDRIPDELVPSVIRGICLAYDRCNDQYGNGSNAPIRILAADDGEGMSIECTIRDTEDEHGNLDGALIEGTVEMYSAGVMISANSVLFSGLPEALIARGIEGRAITEIVDFPLFEGRVIETTKITENNLLASLGRREPLVWQDVMEGWE